MEFIIKTKNLTKSYGKKRCVKQLDLKVPPKCIYGFLGPNGAGKSTTMKMLLGLVKPDSGSIEIFGKKMNDQNRLAVLKETGSLIESPSYYGHLTGRENLEIVCTLKDVPKKEIAEALSIVRLEEQKDKKVSHYSLGMKQRLGLACALLGSPRLLLLDEPTNGLDPAGIQEMRELICSLPKRCGMTVLVSSHLLSEIDQMADTIGIIDKGELIFQDKLSVLHGHGENRLLLRTLDNPSAFNILQENGIPAAVKNDGIVLRDLSDEKTAACIALLVKNGVGVTRIAGEEESLEDIFLRLTGRRLSL